MQPVLPTTAETPRSRAVTGMARIVSGTFLGLGVLAALNTGLDDLGADSAEHLFTFLAHPVTAIAWLLIGLVGIAMGTSAAGSQRFLLGAGIVLVAWAVLALVAGGSGPQWLAREASLVTLHLVAGAAALAAASAPLPEPIAAILEPSDEDGGAAAPPDRRAP